MRSPQLPASPHGIVEILKVSLTYDGSSTPPTDAGTYAVVATIDDANYTGTESGSLVIAKGNQTIRRSGWSHSACPPHLPADFDYLGRTQYMLQQGRPDTDLLVFYGDDGAGIYHHGNLFDLGDLYRGNNHRFDVIDGDSLRNFLKVDQGHIVTDYGSPRYKLLVVMKDRLIKLETLEAIKRLADAGASILFEDEEIPAFNPSLRSPDDARYRQLAGELLGNGTGKRRLQVGAGQVFAGYAEAEVLESLGCRAPFSFTTVSGKGDVHYLRRSFRDDEKIWYFVFNHDRHAATEIIADFRADGRLYWGLVFGILVWWASSNDVYFTHRLLAPLILIGNASYAIYLFHNEMLQAFIRIGNALNLFTHGHTILWMWIYTACILLACLMIHLLIELPILNWSKRLVPRKSD